MEGRGRTGDELLIDPLTEALDVSRMDKKLAAVPGQHLERSYERQRIGQERQHQTVNERRVARTFPDAPFVTSRSVIRVHLSIATHQPPLRFRQLTSTTSRSLPTSAASARRRSSEKVADGKRYEVTITCRPE